MTSIGDNAFSDIPLANITIPNTITNIGSEAFVGCANLTNVGIPESVTYIGDFAFGSTGLKSVTLPSSVTNIGFGVFSVCSNLMAINADGANPAYTSLNGVLYNKNMTTLIAYPDALTGSFTVPDGVTQIGAGAFQDSNVNSITLPQSIFKIDGNAFYFCTGLTNIFFSGNAPSGDLSVGLYDNGTVYYLPGTTGWGSTFGGLPTEPWFLPQPLILTQGSNLGVQSNAFGFTISWATNVSVVVEACTNLANPVWVPIATNVLSSGSASFSDAQWTNYPGRYYRLSSQ